MDDASKALTIAAGVLIGILVLSLAVFLYAYFRSSTGDIAGRIIESRLYQFNNQFLKYVTTDEESKITIYDVVNIANLASENNINAQLKPDGGNRVSSETNNYDSEYVSVVFKNKNIEFGYLEKEKGTEDRQTYYDNLLKTDTNEIDFANNKLPRYRCEVKQSSVNARVYLVVISP